MADPFGRPGTPFGRPDRPEISNAAPTFKGTALPEIDSRQANESGVQPFLRPMLAKRLLNLATWPPVSITRCTPVHAGWDFGSMSRRMVSPALPAQDRVLNLVRSVMMMLISW